MDDEGTTGTTASPWSWAALRMASGVSFLIAPEAANRLWGDEEDSGPTASLLLRSMGYRDALVGGMLLWSGLRNSRTMPGWFLASAGADAADLVGGIANHGRMSRVGEGSAGSVARPSASVWACSARRPRSAAGRAWRAGRLPAMAAPDLLDPTFWADLDGMHAFFTERRAEGPLWRDEANGLWAVIRHAEVLDVERRDEEFTSRPAYRSFGDPSEANMIAKDDPEHIEQRKLVSDRFTPKGVREYVPRLESPHRRADRRHGRRRRAGTARPRSSTRLAAQLPSRLTTDLLGFPEDKWRDVKSWSERLMRIDSVTRDNDAAFGMVNAIQEFAQVLDVHRGGAARLPGERPDLHAGSRTTSTR